MAKFTTRYFIADRTGKALHVPTLSHGPYGGEEKRAFAERVAASIPYSMVVAQRVAA